MHDPRPGAGPVPHLPQLPARHPGRDGARARDRQALRARGRRSPGRRAGDVRMAGGLRRGLGDDSPDGADPHGSSAAGRRDQARDGRTRRMAPVEYRPVRADLVRRPAPDSPESANPESVHWTPLLPRPAGAGYSPIHRRPLPDGLHPAPPDGLVRRLPPGQSADRRMDARQAPRVLRPLQRRLGRLLVAPLPVLVRSLPGGESRGHAAPLQQPPPPRDARHPRVAGDAPSCRPRCRHPLPARRGLELCHLPGRPSPLVLPAGARAA